MSGRQAGGLWHLLGLGVDRLLALDPDSRQRLGELAGRVIAIESTRPALTVYLCPEADGLRLASEPPRDADVRIRGSLGDLVRMARGEDTVEPLEMVGDVRLAQRLQQALQRLDVDWEELLARFVGDLPARQAGRLGRALAGWLREAGRSSSEDVADYLRHEARVVPQRDEVERLCDAVDTLRDDVERLAARVERLERIVGQRR